MILFSFSAQQPQRPCWEILLWKVKTGKKIFFTLVAKFGFCSFFFFLRVGVKLKLSLDSWLLLLRLTCLQNMSEVCGPMTCHSRKRSLNTCRFELTGVCHRATLCLTRRRVGADRVELTDGVITALRFYVRCRGTGWDRHLSTYWGKNTFIQLLENKHLTPDGTGYTNKEVWTLPLLNCWNLKT